MGDKNTDIYIDDNDWQTDIDDTAWQIGDIDWLTDRHTYWKAERWE